MKRREFMRHGRVSQTRMLMCAPYTEVRTLTASSAEPTPPLTVAAIAAAFDKLAMAGLYRQPQEPDYRLPARSPFIADCES